MANDWLQHKQLAIIRGVYAAPGDSNSVEPAIVTLNLMSNNTGIALKSDGWSPNIPSLKDSGVWADSPISDGRTLISGVNSNVVETMQLTITGATFQDVTAWLSALRKMMQDARDFWQANAQISPVYLKWWASCGAGAQYALIYNMDMKPEYVISPTPTLNVTLTIERECFWRAIPPGANPMQWYYESNNQVFNNTKATIFGSTNLASAIVASKSEYSSSTLAALSADNCLTIPAVSIPGDAPALVALMATTQTTRIHCIIGKKTTKITAKSVSSVTIAQNTILNAADGTLGTDATRVNDTGAVKAPGAANAQRLEVSFATATNQLRWRSLSITDANLNSVNRFIGRWQIFLRCRQSAGTLGDITMYLRVSAGGGVLTNTDGVKLNVVFPPVIAGAGNSTDWGLVYMGTISLPLQSGKAWVNDGSNFATNSVGLGDRADDSFDIGLFALRSAGVGLLYLCDLIMIPIDEGSIQMVLQDSAGLSNKMIYDETGYLSHGNTDVITMNTNPTIVTGGGLVQVTGAGIQLTPGVENRLYIMNFDSSSQSRSTDTPQLIVNIVPRWTGIRGG